MATYTAFVRGLGDDELAALLRARPDLASPSPSTLSSLAVRATSRTSLQRALGSVDAAVLQVLEAVVVLDGATEAQIVAAIAGDPTAARHADPRELVGDAPGSSEISDEPGWDRRVRGGGAGAGAGAGLVGEGEGEGGGGGLVGEGVAAARRLALVHEDGGRLVAAPGLAELLGSYPAGLGPAQGEGPAGDEVAELLRAAPAGAGVVLDALLWGPPVGVVPPRGTPQAQVVGWLVARGLLVVADGRHVLLPREVALALRGGRTHRSVARPPASEAVVRAEPVVAAESAAAGERIVRLVAQLARRWEADPPGVLRSGGLGVRELRRVAATLEVDEADAASVLELASVAGLVASDGEDSPAFLPTIALDAWAARTLPQRWAGLAEAWLGSPRAPWLIGDRDDRGALRSALDPETRLPWVRRLRADLLAVLAALPPGTAPTADDLLAGLAWRTPRSVPPRRAVVSLLREAALLGVTGAGALAPAGRALVTGRDAADAFAAGLAPEVDELLLQGDLTGVVPGRPSAELEDVLERAAHVESRGGAVTVRFTPDSVRGALDGGLTADALLAELAAHARAGVPQPLEYLVRDAARRHGRLRAGSASSYLRADDPALLVGLADDPRLATLGLVVLAPTVLAAQAPAREVIEALRERGLSPVAEAPDGQVLHLAPVARRVTRRGADRVPVAPASPTEQQLAELVTRLRGPEPPPAPPARFVPPPADDPADAIALLRDAVAERREVWVELVGGDGRPQRRKLRPLRVDAGRLRALDVEREAELSVALHRIAGVQPLAAAAE